VVPTVPVTAMVLILGIDRFMSECRALTNTMGNGVASIVIAAWEKELDRDRLRAALARPAGAGSVSEASATEGGAMAAAVRQGDARRSI
jgi:aerobic C4-dicarboxylate transport protein